MMCYNTYHQKECRKKRGGPYVKTIDVVGAVIRNEAGEVLCALRSASMSMPGLWEFPGGKIEPGEDPKRALQREIREELGCHITVGDLIADATHAYPNLTVRLLTYDAFVDRGTPASSEHERLLWLPVDRLHTLAWAPADVPTLRELEKK
jgi:8-oxo-dGTP diphosphatase